MKHSVITDENILNIVPHTYQKHLFVSWFGCSAA